MSKHWNHRTTFYRAPPRRRRGCSLGTGELRLMALLGLAAGLVLSSVDWAPSAAPADAHYALVRVIDGDTFDYGGDRIRIADIDTPEVRGECASETALAARATERLDELLAAGPFALEAIGRDEDRYGRKLRIVTRGGESLGAVLVEEGLAREWTGRRMPWCG
jgi:endonuclease YncB( thermonuclease family)